MIKDKKNINSKYFKILVADTVFKICINDKELYKRTLKGFKEFLTGKKEYKTLIFTFKTKKNKKYLFKIKNLYKKIIKIDLNYNIAKRKISKNSRTTFLEAQLIEILYNLLKKKSIFVFHASGVVINKKAYLFLGPSGAGKTTIVSLSKRKIMNDNEILISYKNKKFYAYSSPIQRKNIRPKNIKANIKAIFILKGKNKNYIKRLKYSKALKEIIKNLYNCYSINKLNKKDLKSLIFLINKLILKVPFYELHFKKNRKIWQKIIKC